MYPPSRRAAISGRVGIAMSAGVGVGQAFSGVVGSRVGWRVPFVFVGVAFALLSVALCFYLRTPGVFY